ncbi:MAG: helix-turn-helix transcriptional regulator [Candidatus Parvarchaeota archaeon]|nr:helix-turn-helix transcriptional regulator [Candidatus Parvarchaeota archaeon]MCW1294742.1 helix-turn-helix transcriptional regulator [Candidatus Parvarchaeum tengchongense]MCW1295332.1 helix-turn-helix transcriptional regulator [Candidatus Parvarchaeum tengchongense]MCW1299564.1 helix-turn-helix transcriptional regulator [Candidatus Parvarchaeum tengchongense]MCW1312616.1 helix-turn-helix transcriptional regulator [Candidatus Parvarchaeum tengchongense]
MACNTLDLLNVLGKKWDATVLEEITKNDGINFDKLLSLNPKIYPKTLNKALNDLVKRGLITKKVSYNNNMKRSEYSMTETGKSLISAFESFKKVNCNGSESVKDCGECQNGPNGNQVVSNSIKI